MKSKLVGVLTVLTPLIGSVYGQNVLKNPGFEEEGGWNHWGGVRTEQAQDGKYSLSVHNIAPKWSGSDQIVILPEGAKKLKLSGWMKVDSVSRGKLPYEKARIAVEFYDINSKQTGGYPPVTAESFGSRDWRKYERTYNIPSTAFSVKVQVALGNVSGTAWYDALEAYILDANGEQMEAGIIKATPLKPEDNIRLNQVGYYPQGPKTAVVIDAPATEFSVVNAETGAEVFKGKLGKKGVWAHSEESASLADFSSFTTPGTYRIKVQGLADSYPFTIAPQVIHEVGRASLKTYYYQRSYIDLDEKYAGKWARKAGLPDTVVLVHSSAATAKRPEGTKIVSKYGWFDAGDYNKYIVNSGISTYTMLALYEHFPKFMDTVSVNIPESGNKLPDLLDEVLFNVRWMLSMQDPNDGGVYHKLTNPGFDGVIMPHQSKEPRYVVKKSTAAALDFAAVMAQASRVFKQYSKQLPGLADSTLKASVKAYDWAKKNPAVYYDQNEMNQTFKPAIVTGEYGDKNVKDEFHWAAAELFVTTKKKNYYAEAGYASESELAGVPAWPDVYSLGLITLANQGKEVKDLKVIQDRLLSIANKLKDHAAKSEFGIPMGHQAGDFVWGSNSVAANQGILLIQAYRLTKNKEYLDAAIANLDYILGRNGTGYSYVTAFGTKYSKNPHHRPCEADGIDEVIPGFLAGGPNPDQQDKEGCMKPYPSNLPAVSYIDEECSYASNEIAINWNSPLTYLTFAIEALMAEEGKK